MGRQGKEVNELNSVALTKLVEHGVGMKWLRTSTVCDLKSAKVGSKRWKNPEAALM